MLNLESILKQSDIFKEILSYLSKSDIPNWFICAGFIQQVYFNYRHNFETHQFIKDVDIAFFDPLDTHDENEYHIERDLTKILVGSSIKADAKNQARVHIWYKEHFGYDIRPYRDIFDAIDSFPTTTTALGVRGYLDNLFVYASYGLSDLEHMILRPNKRQITEDIYESKKSKIHTHWPNVKIIEWSEATTTG
jgi:hypothetical protein